MNSTRVLSMLRRGVSTSAVRHIKDVQAEINPAHLALKERQKMFNIDNGLRVHERGGAMDKVLYNLSSVLVVVGGVLWASTIYKMAFPPKN
uniref:Putative cytochrome c oxidase subunit VIIA n=1 Tax=Centropages tenuiremis TaxID=544689 RepID=A0A0U2UQ35_9MAXI|nr:putative cytochrome c oxidase subunit VIIA [Centropages tenuiremis]